MFKFEGYVIYNPATGMYSGGGAYSDKIWRKRPRFWTSIGALKNHIAMVAVFTRHSKKQIVYRQVYKDCQVIDAKTQQPVSNFDIDSYIMDYINRKCQYEFKNNYNIVKE